MAWTITPTMEKTILGGALTVMDHIISDAITITDTELSAGTDVFSAIREGDFIQIIGSAKNHNRIAQVRTASPMSLTFSPGSWVAETAGTDMCIFTSRFGSIKDVFKNSVIRLYSGTRPASPEDNETGTLLAEITLAGGPFTPNEPTNGLNMDLHIQATAPYISLKRQMDLTQAAREIWQGNGLADGTVGWGRWYANDRVTGAATDAIRMDGVVTTTAGGDIVMANGRDVAQNAPVSITDVSLILASA